MRPKKGKQSKQKGSVTNNEPETNGAREQRVRPNRKPPTNTNEIKQPEPSVQQNETPQKPTVNFDNLKRETEEIQKIIENKNFMKREVTSNWSKYDVINDEDEQPKAANFSDLLQAPISQGGHFQFKHEKNWSTAVASKYNEYFTPNINNLEISLQSVPFYKRHCIDSEIFTKDEIIKMDSDALYTANRLKVLNFKAVEKKDYQKIVTLIEDKPQTDINNQDSDQTDFNEVVESQSLLPVDNNLDIIIETKKEVEVLLTDEKIDTKICDKPKIDLNTTDTTETVHQIVKNEPSNEPENSLLDGVDKQIDRFDNEVEDLLQINTQKVDNKNIAEINEQSVNSKKIKNIVQIQKHSFNKKKEVRVEPKKLVLPSITTESSTSHVKAEDLEQWLEDILDD